MIKKLIKLKNKICWNLYLKDRALDEMNRVIKMYLEGKYPEYWSSKLTYLLYIYREIDEEMNGVKN